MHCYVHYVYVFSNTQLLSMNPHHPHTVVSHAFTSLLHPLKHTNILHNFSNITTTIVTVFFCFFGFVFNDLEYDFLALFQQALNAL